jgi:hypothetical protein
MDTTLSWLDRLRIERAIWTLDAHVQNLPGRSRKAIRREIRANLRAATAEVGSAQAIRQLGNLRRLAADYLDAEYGDGSRPHWGKAVFWVLAVEAVLLGLLLAGLSAFIAGVEAANPAPSGTYNWDGLSALGIGGTVSYEDGAFAGISLGFTQWFLCYLLAAVVLGGRLWRLPRAWWRSRRRQRLSDPETPLPTTTNPAPH